MSAAKPRGIDFWENPDDSRHGTTNGYRNLGCRCPRCTAASTAENGERRRARHAAPTPEHVHGTEHGYSGYGCRCPRCTKAWSDASAARIRRARESPSS